MRYDSQIFELLQNATLQIAQECISTELGMKQIFVL